MFIKCAGLTEGIEGQTGGTSVLPNCQHRGCDKILYKFSYATQDVKSGNIFIDSEEY